MQIKPHVQCIVGRLAQRQRVAQVRRIGEIDAARLLQVQVLRGQTGQHTGHNVEGKQRLDGDVVPDAQQAFAERAARFVRAVGR